MKQFNLPRGVQNVPKPGTLETNRAQWGGRELYDAGAPGGNPGLVPAVALIIMVPNLSDIPNVFVMDLEIIDNVTGLPPLALLGAGFRVVYGTGSDSRTRKFPPGIHAVIAGALRVDLIPPAAFGPAPFNWTFRGSCTIQDGVAPSYTWVP